MTNEDTKSSAYEKWIAEARYIESINPSYPGITFNYDPECFADYCNMQANSAEDEDCPIIADEMRLVRDVANPHFRRMKRIEGWAVNGTVVRPPSHKKA